MQPEIAPEMECIYVLDTNVLLYDPGALRAFDEHGVVLPITVIEEVDRFKKDLNETGRNAREASRRLDAMRTQGSLRDGVETPGGGRLWVDIRGRAEDLPIDWGGDTINDNKILRCALRLKRDTKARVVLVSRDTNMRLKGAALGLEVEDYRHLRLNYENEWTGVVTLEVSAEYVDGLYEAGEAPAPEGSDKIPNAFLVLKSDAGRGTAIARVTPDGRTVRLMGRRKEEAWGVFPRNKEQSFAMELLLDPEIQVVTLSGKAGTGKTLMAIACALRQTADEGRYRKVLVSRPINPLGKDLGYLPGDIKEKLDPWMQPIYDNLEFLLTRNESESLGAVQYLLDRGIVQVEALTYIRGRSIPNQFLIVDEAQNLTPHEVKTVLTRAGDGTKVILTGDVEQIDNPYVDSLSNGLAYVIERFKGAPLAGHITLRKGERSALAELAASLL